MQADEGLRQLRFRLVPKYCSEEQFWNRYFAAVERVKQQVKTEQMWGDFDMLDSDGIEPSGEPLQITLPLVLFDQQAAYYTYVHPAIMRQHYDSNNLCILQEANIAVNQLPCLGTVVCSSAHTDIRPAGGICHDLESTTLISPMASIHT